MPLPPALLARLAKRGIVKEQPKPTLPKAEEIEEVFAEDYDDPSKVETPSIKELPTPLEEDLTPGHIENDEEAHYVHEVTACPNRTNPYHVCVKYCKTRWGMKKFSPDQDMLKRRERMLRKYPLPEGWIEVADPDTNRYYYWNLQTDQVCWLSPGHPKALITMSEDKILAVRTGRARLSSLDEEEFEEQEEEMDTGDWEKMDEESDMSDSNSESGSEEEIRDSRRDLDRGKPTRGRGWRDNKEKRGKRRRDDLDPMDPASYSDIPRGTWKDGLDTRGSAKTGVDVTASGPLFQQRPYPSPGDILRANQQIRK